MSERGRFESLEGLRGTGKSTIAPLLAAARGAVLVATVPQAYQALRREVDEMANAEARMCFYLSALLTAAEEIECHLAAGRPVVVESYFARCLATHAALGSRLAVTLPSDLPVPVAYQLVCDATERRLRVDARGAPRSHWDALSEDVADRITTEYKRFQMRCVDTTRLAPEQVVQAILAIDAEGTQEHADTRSMGTHPHVLPAVHGRLEGEPGP